MHTRNDLMFIEPEITSLWNYWSLKLAWIGKYEAVDNSKYAYTALRTVYTVYSQTRELGSSICAIHTSYISK